MSKLESQSMEEEEYLTKITIPGNYAAKFGQNGI